MSMAPTAPKKHAERFRLRDAPYAQEHATSERQRAPTPKTFDALTEWFRKAWNASLPLRSHIAGVEDGSALGSPRMAGPLHRRTDHASDRGWGITGWDRDGRPRGVDAEGLTRDPFLHYVEIRLRRADPDTEELVRWAYMGWDIQAAASNAFVKRIKLREDDPEGWALYLSGFEARLERAIRRLWDDCQSEPIRHSICPQCRRRDCVCGKRSESQVNADEALA